jgi:hypothetical protein
MSTDNEQKQQIKQEQKPKQRQKQDRRPYRPVKVHIIPPTQWPNSVNSHHWVIWSANDAQSKQFARSFHSTPIVVTKPTEEYKTVIDSTWLPEQVIDIGTVKNWWIQNFDTDLHIKLMLQDKDGYQAEKERNRRVALFSLQARLESQPLLSWQAAIFNTSQYMLFCTYFLYTGTRETRILASNLELIVADLCCFLSFYHPLWAAKEKRPPVIKRCLDDMNTVLIQKTLSKSSPIADSHFHLLLQCLRLYGSIV